MFDVLLTIASPWFSFYRSTTWVEKPICVFPTEKVALRELLTAGHLKTPFEKTVFGFSGFSSFPPYLELSSIHLQQLFVSQGLVPDLKVGHFSVHRHHWAVSCLVHTPTDCICGICICICRLWIGTYRLYLWDLFTCYVFDTHPTETMSISFLFFW